MRSVAASERAVHTCSSTAPPAAVPRGQRVHMPLPIMPRHTHRPNRRGYSFKTMKQEPAARSQGETLRQPRARGREGERVREREREGARGGKQREKDCERQRQGGRKRRREERERVSERVRGHRRGREKENPFLPCPPLQSR